MTCLLCEGNGTFFIAVARCCGYGGGGGCDGRGNCVGVQSDAQEEQCQLCEATGVISEATALAYALEC